jgi:hypothetical protein
MQRVLKRMYSLEEVTVTRESLPYIVEADLEDEVVNKLPMKPYPSILLEDYFIAVTCMCVRMSS